MIPSNLVTGRIYSGGNILLLWIMAAERGYDSMQFCTFNQANEIGTSIRKGERGTPILYTSRVTKRDEQSGEDKAYMLAKSYVVFNVAQLSHVPEVYLHAQQPLDLETPQNKARDLVNLAGIDVRFGYNEACYIPSDDHIRMPAFGMFDDEAAFTGTLMHEVTHWTGHENRLDRNFGKRFRSRERAAEELVAEIGSAYLCGRLGYQPTFRSAAYINSWLAILNNDHRAIFSAASYAGHAADWVWNQAFTEEQDLHNSLRPGGILGQKHHATPL
jgi:antirestriction protein ArdC